MPGGRYRITRTLTLSSRINVSVIGEDPGTVTIVWDGSPEGTMLVVNGVAYSRFSRLTYDGARKASVAVEQSWDNAKPHFDTGNEYSDHYFVDVEYGIHGGFKGHGFAETTIARTHFVRNTKAGVALGNFNALDIWIWYSTFEDCAVGVTNEPGAGNFHVYGSTFHRSSVADLYIKNTGGFSARGNYSLDAKAFFLSAGPVGHPATIELQGNTIVDSADASTIRLGNQGPGLLLDNTFRSRRGAAAPIVVWRSFIDADLASVGNTFTVTDAVSSNGRRLTVDERSDAAALTPERPALPSTLPNLSRFVVDVDPNASADALQRSIDRAAERVGTRPVVHIPFGTYLLNHTLTIPPGDLQIVGDGYQTVLQWAGSDSGPVIKISGPTKTTLRELRVEADGKADGIVIEGVDQVRARVYLEGVQTWHGSATNVFLNHLRNAVTSLTDFNHSDVRYGVSVKVLGSRMTLFSGSSSTNALSYEVSDDADVVVRDTWYESNTPGGFVSVHDHARFTMQGSRAATGAQSLAPAFRIENLDGRVAMLSNHIDDRIAITGNGARGSLLALGTIREYRESPYFENTTAPPAAVLMANGRQRTKIQGALSPGTLPIRDSAKIDDGFVREMLSDARADVLPPRLLALPANISDVRMFRVWAGGGLNNIVVSP